MAARPLSIIDAVEGCYVTHVAETLHRAGVLRALGHGDDLSRIAREANLPPRELDLLLAYLADRSDLVERSAEGYRLGSNGRQLAFVEHMLDQYVGGYGDCVRHLDEALRRGGSGAERIDLARHAAAFAGAAPNAELAHLLRALNVDFAIDLGCGGGALLIGAAAANPAFHGVGIEANPHAAAAARANTAAARVADRVSVREGDGLDVLESLDFADRERTQVVVASSFLNSFFTSGSDPAVEALRRIRTALPGRILIVGDYYGRLGATEGKRPEDIQRTLLHDVAQLASGQGVPPGDLQTWSSIYRSAGCTLVQPLEGHGDGIERFIHLVQLAA